MLVKQHLRIITILLESAAVNVPIAVASAVGIENSKIFGSVVGFAVPPSQVCATWSMGLCPTEILRLLLF